MKILEILLVIVLTVAAVTATAGMGHQRPCYKRIYDHTIAEMLSYMASNNHPRIVSKDNSMLFCVDGSCLEFTDPDKDGLWKRIHSPKPVAPMSYWNEIKERRNASNTKICAGKLEFDKDYDWCKENGFDVASDRYEGLTDSERKAVDLRIEEELARLKLEIAKKKKRAECDKRITRWSERNFLIRGTRPDCY